MNMDDPFSFFGKVETPSSFLDVLPPHENDGQMMNHLKCLESRNYEVIHYNEQLYLEYALIVATHTVWKFMVTEERGACANSIGVEVRGNFEPFNEPHVESIPVAHCQSAEEFEQLSKARRISNDVPTWKAYLLPPVPLQNVFYFFFLFFYFFFFFFFLFFYFFFFILFFLIIVLFLLGYFAK